MFGIRVIKANQFNNSLQYGVCNDIRKSQYPILDYLNHLEWYLNKVHLWRMRTNIKSIIINFAPCWSLHTHHHLHTIYPIISDLMNMKTYHLINTIYWSLYTTQLNTASGPITWVRYMPHIGHHPSYPSLLPMFMLTLVYPTPSLIKIDIITFPNRRIKGLRCMCRNQLRRFSLILPTTRATFIVSRIWSLGNLMFSSFTVQPS